MGAIFVYVCDDCREYISVERYPIAWMDDGLVNRFSEFEEWLSAGVSEAGSLFYFLRAGKFLHLHMGHKVRLLNSDDSFYGDGDPDFDTVCGLDLDQFNPKPVEEVMRNRYKEITYITQSNYIKDSCVEDSICDRPKDS